MFKTLIKFILDLFFPKKCLSCGKDGVYICKNCLDKIEIAQNNKCPFCDRPIPNSLICQNCQKFHHLNRLFWAVPYYNPLIKELIRIFKYHYVRELAKPLSKLLIKSLGTISTISTNSTIVIPIPLHKRKLRERGFNQAELLAKEIAEYFSAPMENNVLKRTRFATPQAKIKNYKIRRENIKDIFEISPEFIKKCVSENQNLLKDKIIILVDDVSTTGATLSEAAKVLKRGGAKEVWGLVIAKG